MEILLKLYCFLACYLKYKTLSWLQKVGSWTSISTFFVQNMNCGIIVLAIFEPYKIYKTCKTYKF